MAQAKAPSRLFLSPKGRFMMPILIDPKEVVIKGVKTGKTQYQLRFLFKNEDISNFTMTENNEDKKVNIKEAMQEIAAEKWPGVSLADLFPKATGNVNAKGLPRGWPLMNGDKLADNMEAMDKGGAFADAHRGHTAINMSSNEGIVPTLRIWDKAQKKAVILDRENPKDVAKIKQLFALSGNYGHVEFTTRAYEFNGNFLTTYVNSVMFTQEGEKFGRGSMMDRFGGVDGGEGEYDPSSEEDPAF